MKSRQLIIAAIIAGLSLPLVADAGGDKSHADKKAKYDSSTASASEHLERSQTDADSYMTDDSDFRDSEDSFAMSEDESEPATEWRSSSSSSDARMQLTSKHHIKKVEERDLRDKLMAEDLVGKSVVDRNGQEIGEVKSIALTSLDKQSKQQQSSSQDSMASSFPQSSQEEVHLYIESQDGESIFEVPMSELSFNEQQEEFHLDVAQSDLETLSRRTANLATTDE